MELIWTDLALDSLEDIAEYVQFNFSEKVAHDAVNNIVSKIDILKSLPHIGKTVEGMSDYGDVRCLFHKQNQIYYRIQNPNTIEIIIVWDSRKSPECLLDNILDYFSNL